MNVLIEADHFWPPIQGDRLGIKDGVLGPPSRLNAPESLPVSSSYTIVTPGWFNSHAHLELSGIDGITYDGNFFNWIKDVLDFKTSLDDEEIRSDFREGCRELLESGTAHVVDHCDRTDLLLDELERVDLDVFLFKELVSFDEQAVEEAKEDVELFLESARENDNDRIGLAPHAPYSAHPDLYRWVQEQLPRDNPISTHLHEISSELEFVEEETGPLVDLLKQRSGNEVEIPYGGEHPLPYLLRKNYLKNPAFGVHLNYLNDEDYRWLEAGPVTPVFCPKSYSYFGHETVPVREWSNRSINFGLGTDSLASNDSLDMLQELRRLDELTDEPGWEQILNALTANPARTLGVPDRGVLTWGTPADLSIFEVPSGNIEDLARGQAESLAVIVDGEVRWSAEA